MEIQCLVVLSIECGGSKRDETSRLMIAGADFITRFIY